MSGPVPLLRVVRGTPSDEELAALVAVLSHRRAVSRPAAGPRSAWADRARLLRASLPAPAPGAWAGR